VQPVGALTSSYFEELVVVVVQRLVFGIVLEIGFSRFAAL
jgi:hypothetical protein